MVKLAVRVDPPLTIRVLWFFQNKLTYFDNSLPFSNGKNWTKIFTNSFGQPDRFFTVFLFLTKSLFLNLNLITGLHRWSCTTFIYMSVSPGNCCLFFKIGSRFAFCSLLRHCWSSLEQLGTLFTLFHFERTGRDAAISYRCSWYVIITPRLEENITF